MEPEYLKVIPQAGPEVPAGDGSVHSVRAVPEHTVVGYLVATPKQERVIRGYLRMTSAPDGGPSLYRWSQEPTVFLSIEDARAAYAAAVEHGQGLT